MLLNFLYILLTQLEEQRRGLLDGEKESVVCTHELDLKQCSPGDAVGLYVGWFTLGPYRRADFDWKWE